MTYTKSLFDSPAYNISGYCFWTWKKGIKPDANPYLVGINLSQDWQKTIKWVGNHFNPEPTVTEVQNGINMFLNSTQYTNCVWDIQTREMLKNCSLGIQESDVLNCTIFPVPAEYYVNITSNFIIRSVKFYTFLGKQLKKQQMATQNANIYTGNLPAGVYFVEITTDAQQVWKKILIR